MSDLKEMLFRAFDEGWNKANPEAMYTLCNPGFVHYRPPFPAIESLEAEKRDVENTLKAFSDIQFTIHEIALDGDTAVMRWTWCARYTAQSPDLPIPPNGKLFTLQGCSFIHLADGKIIDEWEFADYLGYFSQLGITQLPK